MGTIHVITRTGYEPVPFNQISHRDKPVIVARNAQQVYSLIAKHPQLANWCSSFQELHFSIPQLNQPPGKDILSKVYGVDKSYFYEYGFTSDDTFFVAGEDSDVYLFGYEYRPIAYFLMHSDFSAGRPIVVDGVGGSNMFDFVVEHLPLDDQELEPARWFQRIMDLREKAKNPRYNTERVTTPLENIMKDKKSNSTAPGNSEKATKASDKSQHASAEAVPYCDGFAPIELTVLCTSRVDTVLLTCPVHSLQYRLDPKSNNLCLRTSATMISLYVNALIEGGLANHHNPFLFAGKGPTQVEVYCNSSYLDEVVSALRDWPREKVSVYKEQNTTA